MYGRTPLDRQLSKLDDRMTELYRLDSAIRLGRIEGELRASQIQNYCLGIGPHPGNHGRTPEYRLMKHLEREWHRIARGSH